MRMVPLTEMNENTTAVVREIRGGEQVCSRLGALGIRPGREIRKVSSHFWKGPVTVLLGKTRIAIGHGMAAKILVEA